uniref:Uncharacterized protein n=1 Tax=Palpitomonas bilix TaxID=652834 RepID=A0A7S3CZP1_9EUKA|mmetsp:Transcript_15992/g.40434  ORF Transcript_15992/g.40434 Transcript_15992/m.40434 type:complete len:166 (+) Transcript_15992:43-540(+)
MCRYATSMSQSSDEIVESASAIVLNAFTSVKENLPFSHSEIHAIYLHFVRLLPTSSEEVERRLSSTSLVTCLHICCATACLVREMQSNVSSNTEHRQERLSVDGTNEEGVRQRLQMFVSACCREHVVREDRVEAGVDGVMQLSDSGEEEEVGGLIELLRMTMASL